MAYTLKYYKEFAWTNYANNTTGTARIEILEDGFIGTSIEIDELGSTPIQLRLDNTGDMINATIKKTSLVLSIVDTDQFDYSQFYTSDGKKYKVNLISSIANWSGYLVPQSFGQELGINGLISITASDGLHLLSGIDYVANKNATLKLSDFIADIETRIGLGIFDKSVSLTTDKGDLWQQYIYEGMFLEKNYEECLQMVLTAFGLQVRYWKIFPVTSILSYSFVGSVKCLDNVPMVDYLPIAKKLSIEQKITTLPNILEDAMVRDVSDITPRLDGYYSTFADWDVAYSNGLGLASVEISANAADNGFKKALDKINVMMLTEGLDKPGYYIVPESGSKYRMRKIKSTDLILRFNANFGKLAVKYPGYTLRSVSWSEITWGLYDNFSDKSYNATAKTWSITGKPTNINANTTRVDDPTDSDVDVYTGITSPTGSYCDLELYLFTGKCKLATTDHLEFYSIMSINNISLDGEEIISDKELYNSIAGEVQIGNNIDIINYAYEFGTCPIPPPNTSLYYGSALYSSIYDQITSFTLAGNSINQMQLLANTVLYSNGSGRKSVFTGTFSPIEQGNLMFYKALVGGVGCLINSFTLDIRRVKFTDAEFVEINPFVFTNYTITSESTIGSSDWGGGGGTSGSVGGGGGSVDLSNCVVKTGATSQDIEGDISVDNMISRGAVVAGALNGTLPDDLPVSSPLLYGVSKYDDVTIKINANGQWYVATSGGTVVSFGTEVAGQSIQLIVAAITKTLALAGHTHNYQPSDNDLTAIASLTGTGLLKRTGTDTWTFDTNAYLTAITKTMVEGVLTGIITSHQHNYLPLSGGVFENNITNLISLYNNTGTGASIGFQTNYVSKYLGFNNGVLKIAETSDLSSGSAIWHDGNDGDGSGLDADLLRGVAPSNLAVASATKLANTRYIWGNAFTGEGNVTGRITFSNYDTHIVMPIGYIGCNTDDSYFWNSSNHPIKFGTNDLERMRIAPTGNILIGTSTDSGYKLDINGSFRAANVISNGAVVAGALNGTLPDDLPVATTSLFGVIKTGLSLNNNVGVVNLNGRHYTTTSTYTDAAVREITAELVLGTGNMTSGTLDQIQLAFAPLTTTRGLTANVIATNTGAGMALKLSFRKDTGSGRWYIMIYNDSGAAVTRDGILLSIRGQQTI